MTRSHIRNFAIIAHVDHGKSTLADRFLEITGVVAVGGHEEQLLDRNPISRERGITIKLAPVTMKYVVRNDFFIKDQLASRKAEPLRLHSSSHSEESFQSSFAQTTDFSKKIISSHSTEYILNLIDTPGHVDFSYEVDRTLACVEGVILLVDATQGVQAQTIANAYKAIEKNLTIIPVVNKVDMANAEIQKTKRQLSGFLGIDEDTIFEISAKTGHNVEELLRAVVTQIPAPKHNFQEPISHFQSTINEPTTIDNSLRALIFDSYYDVHKGVIAFVRVFGGILEKGQEVRLIHTDTSFKVLETGIFKPDLVEQEKLLSGDIGYVATNLKDIHSVEIGDTIIEHKKDTPALPGYKKVKPMVYASVFPTETKDYMNLKKAFEKLYLNDSALHFSAIYSSTLGAGFRVGFLGLLHADVVRERLEREYELSIVLTPPQVEYKIENGEFYEPYAKILIITPEEYIGAVMKLCDEYRATFVTMDNKNQISLIYEIPMSEMISDFFDNLKSVTSGYASLDWELSRYQHVKAAKLELLLNMEPIEEFSEVVVDARAQKRGAELTRKLRSAIPRQQYEVRIQARYRGKIIASERISPFRKDVLIKSGKVIGAGDVGRKKKLLQKQKEGKKLMKSVGRVEIPKDAFVKMFKKNN